MFTHRVRIQILRQCQRKTHQERCNKPPVQSESKQGKRPSNRSHVEYTTRLLDFRIAASGRLGGKRPYSSTCSKADTFSERELAFDCFALFHIHAPPLPPHITTPNPLSSGQCQGGKLVTRNCQNKVGMCVEGACAASFL